MTLADDGQPAAQRVEPKVLDARQQYQGAATLASFGVPLYALLEATEPFKDWLVLPVTLGGAVVIILFVAVLSYMQGYLPGVVVWDRAQPVTSIRKTLARFVVSARGLLFLGLLLLMAFQVLTMSRFALSS